MEEIREGVWFVAAENRGKYPFSNTLHLEGQKNILIDTGAGSLLKDLSTKTDQVVLSHYHRDHVKYNHFFKAASFSINSADAPGIESREGFYRLSGLDSVNVQAYWNMVGQSGFAPTKIDTYINDGDYIEHDRFKIRVLHLPGHTPGHCGFLIEDYNLVFAADIDLNRFGPWYGNPSSDLEQFRHSINRLRSLKPELIITGHSKPTLENIDQKLADYAAIIDQREEAIIEHLRKQPCTLDQLVDQKIIYRRQYEQTALRYFEKNMIHKHLENLLKRGIAAKKEQGLYEAL